ncbi:polysaccharide deacetylase family protein [Coraliomargarita sp. SDUM461003]|uniref:Polysaccharide deacetylase family protein n=1 Tax=Thalassobacterium maritimum TaxID=3041265 RepID=A0ABU1AYM2_9BACT|nr:polysaccharide deacetylase family protein [Coraliomargarita sp. SDUM461003]MDQ8209246.1 polysaccharide deacetylase family protein [Coraliomargarita sp. SDUM461003]
MLTRTVSLQSVLLFARAFLSVGCGIVLLGLQPHPAWADPGATIPAPAMTGNTLLLTAEQSVGGTLIKNKDGSLAGVTLDRSCAANFEKRSDACIEWTLEKPIPAGWWHGRLESDGSTGWANREFRVAIMSGLDPDVMVKTNYTGYREGGDKRALEFWIYTSAPSSSVRLVPKGDLWYYRNTWPVSRLTLVHQTPDVLTDMDAVTMDLSAQADGTVELPAVLPGGAWSLTSVLLDNIQIATTSGEGSEVLFPLARDRWKRPRTANFYMDGPLTGLQVEPAAAVRESMLLRHDIKEAPKSMATEHALMTTVDYEQMETGTLELIGTNLKGEVPTFATYPQGRKIAVVTMWDDGKETDLRAAEILHKNGYRATFLMNENSPALEFLEELKALNGEIGGHSMTHPALHNVSPPRAFDEAAEIRKLLERKLGHPVISFAYPHSYSPAYDQDGDYVLRAVELAGYWSARGRRDGQKSLDSITHPLLFINTNGWIGIRKNLEKDWLELKDQEGAVFSFWGHSWQIGKSEEAWERFEQLIAQFANQPQAWYATQGELSLWMWTRDQVQFEVTEDSSSKVLVRMTRPWLHPWLSERAVLSLRLPDGVERVLWNGQQLPIQDGAVDFTW